jgi:predicted nuclease with TOPRIM domain
MSFYLTEEKFSTFCDIMYETNKAKNDTIEELKEKLKILESENNNLKEYVEKVVSFIRNNYHGEDIEKLANEGFYNFLS